MSNKVLYYPWIEIRDINWLKTSLLYWDEIYTIVPQSIEHPYNLFECKMLEEANILKPFRVNSNMSLLQGIETDVKYYLKTNEGTRIFNGELYQSSYSEIHWEKMHNEVKNEIKTRYNQERNGFVITDDKFADFYMTILANKISKDRGLGLVTDKFLLNELTTRIKKGKKPFMGYTSTSRERYLLKDQVDIMVEGLLAEIIVKNISIRSDIGIDKIINFREKYSNELSRFRKSINDLARVISDSGDIESIYCLREKLESIYADDIRVQISDLQDKLSNYRINTILSDFKLSSIVSIASGLLLGTNALLASAGLSIVTQSILYRTNRNEILRENPFSYVLAAEKELW